MKSTDLVQGQLDAYNSRDLEKFCSFFTQNILIYSLNEDKAVYQGLDKLRENYRKLFSESPNLNAKILNRTTQGDFVIDHEHVTGWRGQEVWAVAIYRITNGKISHVWFAR